MAKCAICEKGAHFGNNVSHSHRRTPKMWKSNVKSVRVKTEGGSKKMYVCTSCLKSGRVERAQSDKDLRHGINPVPKTGIGFYFSLLFATEQTVTEHEKYDRQYDAPYQIRKQHHDKHSNRYPEQRETTYFFHFHTSETLSCYIICLLLGKYSAPIFHFYFSSSESRMSMTSFSVILSSLSEVNRSTMSGTMSRIFVIVS